MPFNHKEIEPKWQKYWDKYKTFKTDCYDDSKPKYYCVDMFPCLLYTSKVKSITPKPMDMEEAIMQMELIGHSFFVYRDAESDSISIVYRRNDGDYGLIETD